VLVRLRLQALLNVFLVKPVTPGMLWEAAQGATRAIRQDLQASGCTSTAGRGFMHTGITGCTTTASADRASATAA
jgi:hypothetical protein